MKPCIRKFSSKENISSLPKRRVMNGLSEWSLLTKDLFEQ